MTGRYDSMDKLVVIMENAKESSEDETRTSRKLGIFKHRITKITGNCLQT